MSSTKTKREDVTTNKQRWVGYTGFHLVMSATRHNDNFRRREGRKYCDEHYRIDVNPAPDQYGVYEFAVKRGNRFIVLYVGKAASKSSKLKQRIGIYLLNGSHHKTEFNRIMTEGDDIYVRWRVFQTMKAAKEEESRLLKRYDYAWNAKEQGRNEIRCLVPYDKWYDTKARDPDYLI
jgi:GIY-YIG domain-containing protein